MDNPVQYALRIGDEWLPRVGRGIPALNILCGLSQLFEDDEDKLNDQGAYLIEGVSYDAIMQKKGGWYLDTESKRVKREIVDIDFGTLDEVIALRLIALDLQTKTNIHNLVYLDFEKKEFDGIPIPQETTDNRQLLKDLFTQNKVAIQALTTIESVIKYEQSTTLN